MLLSIPFELTDALFRHKGVARFLSFVASRESFTAKELIDRAGLSRKSARSLLKTFQWTEHLERKGRRYVPSDKISNQSIVVNLRDERSADLFKWRGARPILLNMYDGKQTLSKVCAASGISYRMGQFITEKLRSVGILVGHELNSSFVRACETPFELVPRRVHRFVLENLVSMVRERKVADHALVFYGDASWGRLVPTLNLLVVFNGSISAEEEKRLMESYVAAAGNITAIYGTTVDVAFALEQAWLSQQLSIVAAPSITIAEASEGLCLVGKLPQREDYFALIHSLNPPPPAKIKEMLSKGYLVRAGDKYVYTDRALQKFREEAPTNLLEVVLPILDRKVRLIMIGKPGR